jgi:hypothetical protein
MRYGPARGADPPIDRREIFRELYGEKIPAEANIGFAVTKQS